ncbi:hypothetical protein M8818_005188 [Zalaria obscura]|uniref:Uncharacterized protein n=1 Tax=Zalaria obscura TaxID=2024903 RepID=A0ACC3SA73_9PEZI
MALMDRKKPTSPRHALQELAKGERTAAALEDHLNTLEARIEELLARADEEKATVDRAAEDEDAADANGTSSGETTAGGHAKREEAKS